MAPKNAQLQRSVFQCDLVTSDNQLMPHGVLEIGIERIGDHINDQAILFRVPLGPIYNISNDVQMSLESLNQDIRIHAKGQIVTTASRSSTPSEQSSFDIVISGIGTPDAKFKGIFDIIENGAKKNYKCVSEYVGERSDNVKVVEEGQKPFPENVKQLLGLRPLGPNGETPVQRLADDIMSKLTVQALSDDYKQFFYNNNINMLHPNDMSAYSKHEKAPALLDQKDGYLNFDSMAKDNRTVLHLLAMHIICRDLSRAPWLSEDYRDHVKDKSGAFFSLLSAPPDVSDDRLQALRNTYGSDSPAINNLTTLRSEFHDVANRCYFTAYVSTCIDWFDILSKSKEVYIATMLYLHSAEFKEHWLPNLFNDVYDKNSLPAHVMLSILQDKLTFLKTMYLKSENKDVEFEDITGSNGVMRYLAQTAHSLGLIRGTMIKAAPEDIKINVGRPISDQTLSMMNLVAANENFMAGGQGFTFAGSVDVRSFSTHERLNAEARPLGLYDG